VAKLDNIPINATVTGTFAKPKVNTDMKSAAASLASSLMKQQKQKAVTKGANALEDLINKNTKAGDTAKTKKVVNQAKDLLNGLFNKKSP